MLKLKYLFENHALTMRCLALYDYDAATLQEMMQHFRISSNAIYPFRSGKDPREVRFLRISPAAEKPAADVRSEIKLIQWLLDNGFSVMRPVPMLDGTLSRVLSTEWGEYNVSCFARVPGKQLTDVDGTMAVVRGYGESLGRLHSLVKQYPAADERRDHKAILQEIGERLTRYGAPELMQRELRSVTAALALLPIHRENYGIIHYDYEPDNVFYEASTGTFSAIDFDDAFRGWFALDIVQALYQLDDIVSEADWEEAKTVFLSGYRAACAFSAEEEQTLPLMRRFALLQGYAMLLYAMSEKTAEEPDWLVGLKEKLTRVMRWMESTVKA